jgi:hypothetical protein
MASSNSILEQERPKVIKYGFDEFVIKDKHMSARCKFCRNKTVISDTVGTTSNFVKHLQRKHPIR